MPRRFDPDKQCGAPTKSGKPCTQPKGFATIHLGTGFCHLHCPPEEKAVKPATATAIESSDSSFEPLPDPFEEDTQTSAIAKRSRNGIEPAPKQAIAKRRGNGIAPAAVSAKPSSTRGARLGNQYARKHGLYSQVLTGEALVRYQTVAEHDPGDVLRSNFALIQSKLLGIIEGDVKYDKQSETLMQAAVILMEEGELSEDFVDELRLKLVNFDTARLAGVFNSTIGLAHAAINLDRAGQLQQQVYVLTSFLRQAMRLGDRTIRELGLTALQELKLSSGMPAELLAEILEFARASAAAEAEEDAIEADAEDVLGDDEAIALDGQADVLGGEDE